MTPTPEVIRTLIERVEQGSGPDRDLDLAIGALWPEENRPFNLTYKVQRNTKPPCFEFTGSRDAAVAITEKLLPNMQRISGTGVYRDRYREELRCCARIRPINGRQVWEAWHVTSEPRAILSALFHALLQRLETGGGDE